MILRRSLTLRTTKVDNGYRMDIGAELLNANGNTVWSMRTGRSQDDPPTEAQRRDIVDALMVILDRQTRRRLARTYGDPIRV